MALRTLIWSLLCLIGLMPAPVDAQSGKELARLQQAGIRGETLAMIVKEKIIPTQALTVDELVQLKLGGMSNEILEMLIQEATFMKKPAKRVYGDITRTIESLTAKDLIRLKQAGLSDEVLRSVVVYRSADSSASDKAQAWEMLKNMDISLLLQ
jgi:hypothetical protein